MRLARLLRSRWLMWRASRDFAAAARHREIARAYVIASELTHAQIMACYEEPVRTGLLQPRTARDRIVVLKQLQDFARKHGHMRSKPVDEVLDELKGIKDRKVRSFTVEQVRTLLRATEQRPKNWEQRTSDLRRIIVHLAAVCGLR